MNCLREACLVALCAAFGAGVVTAQRGVSPDEFLDLEPVLQAALRRAAPFTVAIETFGGTRQVQGKDGPMDGEMPPQPRQAPKPKPEPVPKPEPGPDEDKKDDEKKEDDKKEDKKPKKPLVAGGFKQTLGKTTGIVLTADGWILVSRFALALEPTTILVTVPGRGTFHAQRAGEDTSRGIALVKIEAQDLPVPEFADPEEVKVGQWAFALGRTFANDEPTVHFGIVSAKNRLFGRTLQIDAYTSPANYGGPVVDVRGRVLGMAVPLSPSGRNAGVEWYDSGIGFATTIHGIEPLLTRMQAGEVLQRAWLGVQFSPSHLGPGAKIAGTPKDGPAANAQTPLRKGDIIVAVDGVEVKNGPHCLMLVSSKLGGDKVTLRVRRDDAELPEQEITLANAPWSEQQHAKDADLPASFPLPEKNDGR
ncbi:MAG: trypsin-like peptidase domain-containing protein [Planctomycetes bacterium]|nr:trypsin-like peptidase domain-containing protein [Planctomycetota bacterium]MCB9884372.1 trypsin-like peptidase domain-containing protein [Planctomycetota bacterium]